MIRRIHSTFEPAPLMLGLNQCEEGRGTREQRELDYENETTNPTRHQAWGRPGVYFDRTAGRDQHHRRDGGVAPAGTRQGQAEGPRHPVLEQP